MSLPVPVYAIKNALAFESQAFLRVSFLLTSLMFGERDGLTLGMPRDQSIQWCCPKDAKSGCGLGILITSWF